MSLYFDHNGKQISLGRQIGTGGEGAVFEIPGSSNSVAKLYHRAVPNEKREKLSLMARAASNDILTFAAWPVTTLQKTQGGEVVGLVMPRISDAKDIHQLYSPAQRRTTYPSAD